MTTALTVYSTTWCGFCHRLMEQLDREGVAYAALDIEREPGAAQYVMDVNGGNQTVPTVVFADGSALTGRITDTGPASGIGLPACHGRLRATQAHPPRHAARRPARSGPQLTEAIQ